mgnify:CR=1 FL=1
MITISLYELANIKKKLNNIYHINSNLRFFISGDWLKILKMQEENLKTGAKMSPEKCKDCEYESSDSFMLKYSCDSCFFPNKIWIQELVRIDLNYISYYKKKGAY